MALANLACLLASRSHSDKPVLMVDWDLEAPGLHQYFYKHMLQQSGEESEKVLKAGPGLIDLFYELDNALSAETSEDFAKSEDEVEKTLGRLSLEKFVLKTSIPSLFLLKAGKFDEAYSTRVNSFDWEKLHSKAPQLFRVLANFLSEQYEYVLIDSRTGLTDTSGICTMLMPEKLVVVFTPNRQSLTGVKNLMKTAADYRKQSDDLRSLLMFPLISRLEPTENTLRQYWRYGNEDLGILGYQGQFEGCFREIYGLDTCSLDTYFDDVLLQHVPSFAYGEEIAVLHKERGDSMVLKRRYENLLKFLLRPSPPWVADDFLGGGINAGKQIAEMGEAALQLASPYPGLMPFEEKDQMVFFAREKATERLLKCLRPTPRFLALFGPSGSGKSSLINAGLIPRLRRGDLPVSEHWKIMVCPLGHDPFRELEGCGLPGAEDDLPLAVINFLSNNPLCPRILLIIDQFEELFFLVEKTGRERFIEQLIRLLSSDVHCVVLLVMRDDFYSQLVHDIPSILPWLDEGLINIPPILENEELRAIVAEPAHWAGISFEEGLVETIVHDAVGALPVNHGGRKSAHSSILPLLQFSLSQMWERKSEGYISHSAYREVGGLEGGLVTQAETVFAEFTQDEREMVRRILTGLVQIGEDFTDFRRRRRNISDLIQDRNARLLAERLVDSRLVVIARKEEQGEETIELTHESLIFWWPRLRQWLDEEREFLLWQERLIVAIKEWEQSNWSSHLLLRSLPLAKALAWLKKKSDHLTEEQRKFIRVSRNRKVIGSVSTAMVGSLMLLVSVWAMWLWQKGYNWDQAILKVQSVVESIYVEPAMILIDGGAYKQGDIYGLSHLNEQPVHDVMISTFAIGKFEVTFEEYDKFAIWTGRPLPYDGEWGRGGRPVINVSWDDAVSYAQWLSEETGKRYRLPTEAEWEYAARSRGKNVIWAGTSDKEQLAEYAVYSTSYGNRTETILIGSKKPNELGLFDMSGNVWEWIEDCWHEDYEGAPDDGTAWLKASEGDCTRRGLRGGSWVNTPGNLRLTYRGWGIRSGRYGGGGFRLAQDVD